MCHYCGCRQMPLIRDYIDEHERATNLAGEAVRAIDLEEYDRARRCIAALASELASHWEGEESGIFRVMRREPEFAEYISPLVREHRELAELLGTVDVAVAADQQRIRVAVAELVEHISREEDGLFPASLTALTGRDWDDSIAAWHEAHPGELLIGE